MELGAGLTARAGLQGSSRARHPWKGRILMGLEDPRGVLLLPSYCEVFSMNLALPGGRLPNGV